jgi:hypothetical protein
LRNYDVSHYHWRLDKLSDIFNGGDYGTLMNLVISGNMASIITLARGREGEPFVRCLRGLKKVRVKSWFSKDMTAGNVVRALRAFFRTPGLKVVFSSRQI